MPAERPTSAFPEEIKSIFPKTIDVGIEHGTVLILDGDEQYEMTTFRTESTYQDYRRPDEVTFVRSLEEDLKRRDFTMNALAMGKDGQIIDLFNGIEAIEKKQIVAVGEASERFHEDALRMMRGLRFASQLGFEIEPITKQAIKEHHTLLDKISVERIYVEFIKLLTANYRNKGLEIFIETDCFRYCPGLENYELGLRQLLLISDDCLFETEEIAWLVLSYLLEIESIKLFLKLWKTSNKLMNHVENCLLQLRRRERMNWTLPALYESGPDVIRDVETARNILGKSSEQAEALEKYQSLSIKSIRDLAVTGKDIMLELERKPGPWLGEILKELELAVVLGNLNNEKELLLLEAKKRSEKLK